MRITQLQQTPGNLTNMPDILGKLNVGDVVRAQILDFTANELILKLFDGKTVTAAASTPVDAKRGDFVDFTVKGKSENQVILEQIKTSEKKENDPDIAIKKQLLALDLKPEEKSIEIAKEINKYNLPFNKETFQSITDLLSKFKALTPEKAAFLSSSNINIEEKNIASLNQLISGKAKISADLSDLADTLTDLKDQKVIRNIVKQLTESNPARFSLKADELPYTNIDLQSAEKNLGKQDRTQLVKMAINDFSLSIQQESSRSSPLFNNASLQDVDGLKESIFKLVSNNNEAPEKMKSELQQLLSKSLGSDISEKVRSEMNLLLDKINNRYKDMLKYEENTVNAAQTPIENDSDHKNILHRVLQKLYVNPESDTIKEDVNLKSLYRDISKVVEIIRENIDKSSIPAKNEMMNKIDSIDNNIRFINDLNNHNTYIQLPIHLRDTNTQGELYILKKESKRRKIDPENVTMFISLDTIHIGRVDSLIKLDRKNVSVNMRVEDKRVFDLIREKYKDLYNVLNESGYKLINLNYRMIEETPNIMNIESIAKKEDERNRRSIDYRL